MIDLASVPALLRSIFAFMTDRLGTSGTVFERLFREALERRGFKVFSGKLVAHDGSERELDAGVWIGDRMYFFECVPVERPLDYEIGKPRTMAVRKERLVRTRASGFVQGLHCQEPLGSQLRLRALQGVRFDSRVSLRGMDLGQELSNVARSKIS